MASFYKQIKMNISPGFSDQFLGNKFILYRTSSVECNGAVVLHEPPAAGSVHRPLVSHL